MNKTALVTGANRGIGLEISKQLAEKSSNGREHRVIRLQGDTNTDYHRVLNFI